MDPDALLATIRTNTAAPALISQVVLPFLERGRAKKVLHITSTGGSIGSVDSDRMQDQYRKVTSYAMSKTALNMLVGSGAFGGDGSVLTVIVMQAYKQKVERPDLVVITMCPGWVKTGEYSIACDHFSSLFNYNSSPVRHGWLGCCATARGEYQRDPEGHNLGDARRQWEVPVIQRGRDPVVEHVVC